MIERWFGIHKLVEEMGELLQVIGKLGEYPEGDHPDGAGDLTVRLREELTDVKAAIAYFEERNQIPEDRNRFLSKLSKFRKWGLAGNKRGIMK